MNKTALAKKIRQLTANPVPDDFIFDLLLAYKLPKSSVTILKNGPRNMLAAGGGVTMKRKLFFLPLRPEDDPLTVRDEIRDSLTENQRFIVLTDYVRFYGYDTKLDEALDCDFTDLADHYDFFLPWAGIEKTRHYDENPADVKAAERMAKLFDVIKRENPDDSPAFVHDLNVFLSRVLFCFFAEDTGIFPGQNLFSNGIGSQTALDGHDLQGYLTELFTVLDLDSGHRTGVRAHFLEFPYVNGGLFRDRIQVPTFSARSRRALIDAGTLNWSDINPDIFGSMIQAVVTAEHRGGLGMHYTSVPNIMKVIEPLFLNDLRETFTKAYDGRYEKNDLKELRERIGKLKIFDPACGSGNFLIIAYKELRRLEMEIIQRQADLGADAGARGSLFERGAGAVSTISLNQFYGIEIDDFAHEIAILALWLAEHQMNADFERVFGQSKPTLPLADAGHIVHGNACRVDWEEVCPKVEGDETYILGNPPYLGYTKQSKDQKSDVAYVFTGLKNFKKQDYVACWIFKSAVYISNLTLSTFSFVTTNSVCQGEQVKMIWERIANLGQKIVFAHPSFKWTNQAKDKAAVIVIIFGMSNDNGQGCRLYLRSGEMLKCKNINFYLAPYRTVFVEARRKALSNLPSINKGSQPADGGSLVLDANEYDNITTSYPEIKNYLKSYIGSNEFLHDIKRYCLWLSEENISDAITIPIVRSKLDAVREMRLKSTKESTNVWADKPFSFTEIRYQKRNAVLVPEVSSENREYLPVGYCSAETVPSNKLFAIYDGGPKIISVLESRIHMVWMRTVAGRMKMDYSYSSGLVYNTFPFPSITPAQEATLTGTALGILTAREQHPGSTLAELYDPDKMPENLREAHQANDLAVEACYRAEPFGGDEERLAYLFKLYEEMIAAEKEEDTLFAATKKKGKRRKKG
jgi:hypothetical protein